MKKTLAILTLTFVTLVTRALTPWYYSMLNSDGSPNTNLFTMQAWPPPAQGFTVYGTNIVFGNAITYMPNAAGFSSNSSLPNKYLITVSNATANANTFYVSLPDTASYVSLASYATNIPAVAGATTGNGIIVSALGYIPATNGLGNAISFIQTNGYAAWVTYNTNSNPGPSFTNLANGSLCTTTNGQLFCLSNMVWNLK